MNWEYSLSSPGESGGGALTCVQQGEDSADQSEDCSVSSSTFTGSVCWYPNRGVKKEGGRYGEVHLVPSTTSDTENGKITVLM